MGIILNPELERRIAEKLKGGEYTSAHELISKSLDLLDERDRASLPAAEGDSSSIWEVIEGISRSVPDEEWAKIPPDLSKNHDHYLYGAPKVEE